MRKVVLMGLIAVFLAACGAAPGPRSTVEKLVKAIENGDGRAMIECMHPDIVAEIEESLVEIKENPEDAVLFLGFMGVETTADEIRNMDAGGFMTLMFKSPMFSEEFSNLAFSVGSERIEGDVAFVDMTVNGESSQVKLVRHGGRWVIDPDSDLDLLDIM